MEAPSFLLTSHTTTASKYPSCRSPSRTSVDGLRDPVLLEIGARPLGRQAVPQARRGGLGAAEADGVDEDLPDEVEDELDPLFALLRDPDVGEEAGAEDLLDGLVDEPRREGVARPDGDEVEEPGFARTAVDPDDDAVDDRALLGREGPRAGHGQDDGEGQDRRGPTGPPPRS